MSIGYQNKNMGDMLSCWSNAMIKQTWGKYVDTIGNCPFHWIHKACSRFNTNDAIPRGHMSPGEVLRMGGDKASCYCGKRSVYLEER